MPGLTNRVSEFSGHQSMKTPLMNWGSAGHQLNPSTHLMQVLDVISVTSAEEGYRKDTHVESIIEAMEQLRVVGVQL